MSVPTTCKLSTITDPSPQNGVPVAATDNLIPLKTGGLLLAPADISHSGTYTCVADNGRESEEATAVVFVKRELTFTVHLPTTTDFLLYSDFF